MAHGQDLFPYMEMDGADPMLWFGNLTPIWNDHAEAWNYGCGYLAKGSDSSLAACTRHSSRPTMCSGFPYGSPVKQDHYSDCAFVVQVVDFNLGTLAVDNVC